MLQVTISDETAIQRFAEGTLDDLVAGQRVTVTGATTDDGTVEARSILVAPEGAEGLFGERQLFGGRMRERQQP